MTGVNLFLIFRVNLLVPLVTPSVLESVWQSNGSALTQETFESFRGQFRRSYELHSDEYNRRKLYFENTIKRHAHLNSFSTDKDSAKYGINQFSDLSLNEFRERHATATAEAVPEYPGLKTNGLPVPAKFDWRDKGAVGPVQDQQACGSCWAFSVVGAVQAVHAMAGLPVEQLSVQQVVDCSYRDQGCNGGSTTKALAWMKQTRVKLVQQSDYPYKAESGLCHFFSASHDGVSVKDFAAYDFSGREEAMMGRLVEWGPLAVTVDAISWQDYLGGIIQHHCSSHHANHAVLIVGYDTMGAVPYWIVQNSWGTSWGNKGYVYIKMGGDVCGVADSVAAVLL